MHACNNSSYFILAITVVQEPYFQKCNILGSSSHVNVPIKHIWECSGDLWGLQMPGFHSG